MGLGFCRFDECQKLPIKEKSTNLDYNIILPDQNLELCICGLWEHYATQHNVLPPRRARDAVMAADPSKATTNVIRWRGQRLEILSLYFVEKTNEGYNHKIGDSLDTEFITKLKQIIGNGLKNKAKKNHPFYSTLRS